MSEQTDELEALAARYGRQERELENQLAEVKRLRQVVSEALGLLRGEVRPSQQGDFKPSTISEKYRGLSMTVAIRGILQTPQFKKASAAEILSELQRHGYQSRSKTLKRDVHTRLYRMEKDGHVESVKVDNVKKYSLPKEEGDA